MGNLRNLLTAILSERHKRLSGEDRKHPIFNRVFEKQGFRFDLATLEDQFKIYMTTNESMGARIKFAKYDNAHQASNEKPDFTAAEVATIGLELLWLSSCWLYSDKDGNLQDFESAVRDWRNSKLDTTGHNQMPWSLEESYMLRSLGKVGSEKK